MIVKKIVFVANSTVSSFQVDSLQANLNNLQEERVKILNLLQREREKAFAAVEKIEEHVELKVEQQIKIRERELQEHFYEQTEALHSKVKSLQEALEVMRKNEDIADFDMTSDGITMPLLKTAFMQLQVSAILRDFLFGTGRLFYKRLTSTQRIVSTKRSYKLKLAAESSSFVQVCMIFLGIPGIQEVKFVFEE